MRMKEKEMRIAINQMLEDHQATDKLSKSMNVSAVPLLWNLLGK